MQYPIKFFPGDTVICKKSVEFVDGTSHYVGQRIEVTENDVSYYNVNHANYDLYYEPGSTLDFIMMEINNPTSE